MVSSKGLTSLTLTVRPYVVARFIGELCLSLAAMSAVPCAVTAALGELALSARLAVVAAVFAGLYLWLRRLPDPNHMQVNEALVTLAVTFVIAAAGMTWPLMAAGLSLPDAVFESVSAVTTTGLSTVAPIEGMPAGFLFTRAWLQWYGGLLIVVLALALMVEPGSVAKRLSTNDLDPNDLVGSTRVRARRALVVYGILSAVCCAVLMALGVGGFDALLHTMTAVSTAGFSSHSDSLAGVGGWPAQAATMVFCLAGAISFSVYAFPRRGQWWRFFTDLRVVTLVACCVLASALLAAAMALDGGYGWREIAANAPLVAVSAQTTTGFETISVAELGAAAQLVLIVAMTIGGNGGSTAGGIKTLRLLILIRLVQSFVLRASSGSHAVITPTLGGHRLSDEDFRGCGATVVLFTIAVAAGWFVFLLYDYPAGDALFEVVSALCTVGLSAGLTGPDLETPLKAVLCVLMLIGRLEVIAFVVLFYPRTWIRH